MGAFVWLLTTVPLAEASPGVGGDPAKIVPIIIGVFAVIVVAVIVFILCDHMSSPKGKTAPWIVPERQPTGQPYSIHTTGYGTSGDAKSEMNYNRRMHGTTQQHSPLPTFVHDTTVVGPSHSVDGLLVPPVSRGTNRPPGMNGSSRQHRPQLPPLKGVTYSGGSGPDGIPTIVLPTHDPPDYPPQAAVYNPPPESES